MPDLAEVLLAESVAQPVSRIRQQSADVAATENCVELFVTFLGCQVGFNSINRGAGRAESAGCFKNRGLICHFASS